jgi:hypothetical protein
MSVENKTQFEIDYEGGKQNESSILNIIRTYFNRDISHVTDAFSSYDFECDTFKYELKSRNIKYGTYPTIIIGCNKIIAGTKQIFLFKFNDELYYIRYRQKVFNEFERKQFKRFQRTGYNDKNQECFFIPIDKLIKII